MDFIKLDDIAWADITSRIHISCDESRSRLDDALAEYTSGTPSPNSTSNIFTLETMLSELEVARQRKKDDENCWRPIGNTDVSHFFMAPCGISVPNTESVDAWATVRAVAVASLKPSAEYVNGFKDLCSLAQRIFFTQPDRLLVQGIYMLQDTTELWTFDRSGAYCSAKSTSHVNAGPPLLLSLFNHYTQLSDQELGVLNVIQSDVNGEFIVLEYSDDMPTSKMYLGKRIAFSDDVVGGGLACFKGRLATSPDWRYAVKFKWRLANDRPEENIMKLAQERNVQGVLTHDYSRIIATTADLRFPLKLGPYRVLNTEGKSTTGTVNNILAMTRPSERTFENRILSCIIGSPLGRDLNTFQNADELLRVIRDGILGHRSLFQEGRILHQDISLFNIIIVDRGKELGSTGVLIDFDLAVDLDDDHRGEGEIMGMRPFMAIGVLLAHRHTYRHDVESFLYVLLWTIISNGEQSPPEGSKLLLWRTGSFHDAAEKKKKDLTEQGFEEILAEFDPAYEETKPIIRRMRNILFLNGDDHLWIGTNGSIGDTDDLYDRVISNLDQAIERS